MIKQKSIGKLLSYLRYLPYVLILVYAGVIGLVIWKLPKPEDLLRAIEGVYRSVGYPLVFLAAIMESTFLLGFYVPGSTVILFGAALAKTGAVSFPVVLLLGTLGLLIGYTINYFLGRYGWYHVLSQFGFDKGIQEAEKKLKQHGGKALFVGYLFPNGAAFMSTAAGVLKMPFQKFLLWSIASQTFWSLLWGSIAYTFGMLFVEAFMKYFGFIVWGVIGIWILRKYVFTKKV